MEDDDRSLWSAVLAGDDRSFGTIFTRHRDRVFRALLRSAAPTDAEDLTAVVFLELWRRRDSARLVNGTLLPWLLVTAANVARNANRSRRRYAAFLAALPEPEPSPDVAPSVDARLDARDATVAIHDAIAALKPIDRDLIALTAIEGFSLDEAALAVGVSYNVAKTRISRARGALRSRLPHLTALEGH